MFAYNVPSLHAVLGLRHNGITEEFLKKFKKYFFPHLISMGCVRPVELTLPRYSFTSDINMCRTILPNEE